MKRRKSEILAESLRDLLQEARNRRDSNARAISEADAIIAEALKSGVITEAMKTRRQDLKELVADNEKWLNSHRDILKPYMG